MRNLQNIKNFRPSHPSEKNIQDWIDRAGCVPGMFLKSDCGKDWYECQALFSDDTIKVFYDADSIIRAIIDRPLPGFRPGVIDVNAVFPVNLSVAEVESVPAGCNIYGEWVFDGVSVTRRISEIDELIAVAEKNKSAKIDAAEKNIRPLQYAYDLGIATEKDKAHLTLWKKYAIELMRVDTNKWDPEWPVEPVQAN